MFSCYIWDSCSFLKRGRRSRPSREGWRGEELGEEDGGKNCYQNLINEGAEGEGKITSSVITLESQFCYSFILSHFDKDYYIFSESWFPAYEVRVLAVLFYRKEMQ